MLLEWRPQDAVQLLEARVVALYLSRLRGLVHEVVAWDELREKRPRVRGEGAGGGWAGRVGPWG